MEDKQHVRADLIHDDMDVIRSLKRDLMEMVKRIARSVETGTLKSIEVALIESRLVAMEMCLEEILAPDWNRLSQSISSNKPMPRSEGYKAWLARLSRPIPTNPATYEMAGASL